MRFITLVTLFAGTGFALSAVPCLKLANAIRNFDAGPMANSLLAKACDTELGFNLSDYPIRRDGYVEPLLDQISQEVGGSRYKDLYMDGVDQLYELAKEKCASKLPQSQNFCENKDMTKIFVKCVKANAWTIAVNNVSKFKILLEEPLCQQHVDFLKGDKLERAITTQLEKFIQDQQKE